MRRLEPRETHRIARDVTYGLIALLVFSSMANWYAGTQEAAPIIAQNLVSAAVLAASLALRGSARSYTFIGILTLLATVQVATDTFTEQQGLWLFLITARAADRLEVPARHRRLGLALLVTLLVSALTVSGLGYVYVPITSGPPSPTLRLARALNMTALWGTTAWLLYVVEWRPEIEFRRRMAAERQTIERQLRASGILDDTHYLRDDHSIGEISLAKRMLTLLGQDAPKDPATTATPRRRSVSRRGCVRSRAEHDAP